MPFRLSATYRLSPWLLAPSVISTNDFAYLPGLLAARPSAFVEGEGIEPSWSHDRLPLKQMRLPFRHPSENVYPDSFFLWFFLKPANLSAGWINKNNLLTF